MTQPSGWYDDPQDPSQLRYWDGVVWSSHVTPKVSPTVEQSTIGMPYGVTPAAARPPAPGSQGAQGNPVAPGGYGPAQQWRQGEGQPGGPVPPYAQPLAWQSQPSTTPDGQPLAGWWLRVLARLLDGLFTTLLALPLTGWFYYRYVVGFVDWSNNLASQTATGTVPVLELPPSDVLQYAMVASFIGLAVAAAYEVFFLRRSGATPGKKIVGISIRLRDQAGPPPLSAILGRTVCYFGFQLVGVVTLIDVLWPLWDVKKQAIHDKVVGTNVVVGPQPRRGA